MFTFFQRRDKRAVIKPANTGIIGGDVRILQGHSANVRIYERSKYRLEQLERQLKRYLSPQHRKRSELEIDACRAEIKRMQLQMEVAAMNMREGQ